ACRVKQQYFPAGIYTKTRGCHTGDTSSRLSAGDTTMIARRTLQSMILATLATTIIIGGFFIGKWYLGGPLTIDVSGIDMNQSKLFVNNQLYNLDRKSTRLNS